MTEREALKLALEALELIGMKNWSLREDKAITAIKEVLMSGTDGAQSESCEYCKGTGDVHSFDGEWRGVCVCKAGKALAQPEQEQLMSDQINYGMSVTQVGKRIDPMSIYKEPEQEPVPKPNEGFEGSIRVYIKRINNQWERLETIEQANAFTRQRLASKPLTDEEIADIVVEMNGNEPTALFWRDLTHAIEAAHGIKENT